MNTWDKVFSEKEWGRYPSEDLVRFVARTFKPKQHIRALEVGCGPGANLGLLQDNFCRTYGIDGSSVAIKRARITHPNAILTIGNFKSLPYPDKYFDLVVDLEAICANDVPTIDAALTEVYRVLKPGGWFFAKMFGDMTTAGIFDHICPVHYFTEDEITLRFHRCTEFHYDHVDRSDNGVRIFEWIVRFKK